MLIRSWWITIPAILVLVSVLAFGQVGAAQQSEGMEVQSPAAAPDAGSTAASTESASEAPKLRIGPGDELDIAVFGIPELSQHARVTTEGNIYMPLLGAVPVSGLTLDEAQSRIASRLEDGAYVKRPQVLISVKEYTHQSISVIGEVAKPGVYPVLGPHTLLEVLLMAGGLGQKAGNTVTITHRNDPNNPEVVEIGFDLQSPHHETTEIIPGDIISVSRAGIVYVIGEVNRPGGFVMEKQTMALSDAIALAAGPTHGAAMNGTKILRRTPTGLREFGVPLKKILSAKKPDLQLKPEDIVFVPASFGKHAASIAAPIALGTAATFAIYRPF
jgi:polysaccharide export outer membrane protein